MGTYPLPTQYTPQKKPSKNPWTMIPNLKTAESLSEDFF